MNKKLVLLCFLFFFFKCLFSFSLKSPILVLGPDEDMTDKKYYKLIDVFKIKDVLIYEKKIFLLSNYDSKIYVFNMKGDFKYSFGGLGSGPKELYKPRTMTIFNNSLFVSDYGNSRIQIYKLDGKHVKSIKLDFSPSEIVSTNDYLYVGRGVSPPWAKCLIVFDKKLNIVNKFKLSSNLLPKTNFTPWYNVELEDLSNDKILMGYLYLPIIAILNKKNNKISYYDMSKYYTKYETKASSGERIPTGYATTAFTMGPNNSILVSICNDKKKKCNKILQFNLDLTKKIGEFKLDYHFWDMEYFEEEKLLVFISGGSNVWVYKVN